MLNTIAHAVRAGQGAHSTRTGRCRRLGREDASQSADGSRSRESRRSAATLEELRHAAEGHFDIQFRSRLTFPATYCALVLRPSSLSRLEEQRSYSVRYYFSYHRAPPASAPTKFIIRPRSPAALSPGRPCDGDIAAGALAMG